MAFVRTNERTNERTNGSSAVSGAVDYHVVLADAREKRDALDRLISALEALTGVPPTPVLPPAPLADEPPRAGTVHRARPPAPASPATNGTGHEDKVLQLLKGGEMRPRELYQRLGLPASAAKRLLYRMRDANTVTITGRTHSARVALA